MNEFRKTNKRLCKLEDQLAYADDRAGELEMLMEAEDIADRLMKMKQFATAQCSHCIHIVRLYCPIKHKHVVQADAALCRFYDTELKHDRK